jgi:15-cis-phytoene synthase
MKQLGQTSEKTIFKKGSTTYYFSSLFFPKKVKSDVFKLYSFVRVADDYVDAIPAKNKEFWALRSLWDSAKNDDKFDTHVVQSDSVDLRVVKNMVYVMRKYSFEKAWVESFLDSMQADIDKKQYRTMKDTIWYMYGSAEVIGLMMAKILGLPNSAQHFAQLQGRAMQYINFVRDIAEDIDLGRQYFPKSELKKFGLHSLSKPKTPEQVTAFNSFIKAQIDIYKSWQDEANQGYRYIPKRFRVPLQTAASMYDWTASIIYKQPHIVFDKKVKPSKQQVLCEVFKNSL